MMKEYQIANKITSLMGHFKGNRMNCFMISAMHKKMMHVIKECDEGAGWHRRIISLGISDMECSDNMIKASICSKRQLDQLINMLVNLREELDF